MSYYTGNSLRLLIPGQVGRTLQATWFSWLSQFGLVQHMLPVITGQGYIFKAPTDRPWHFVCFTADYELTQLQEKLRETEEAMEKLMNRVGPNSDRYVSNYSFLRREASLIKNYTSLHWLY